MNRNLERRTSHVVSDRHKKDGLTCSGRMRLPEIPTTGHNAAIFDSSYNHCIQEQEQKQKWLFPRHNVTLRRRLSMISSKTA